MRRSTIQDKLSGKNLPRTGQTLALVQAFVDYAAFIGVTLSDRDTDERVWRERTEAAWARATLPAVVDKIAPQDETESPHPTAETATGTESPRFNLDPLMRAGMHDMVDLLQADEESTAVWLPTLVEALREAEMSNEQFLLAASQQQPQEVVQSILALAYHQEDQALYRLISLTVTNQPPESIPIILALLRRKGMGDVGTEIADRLINAITGKTSGPSYILAKRRIAILHALRSATMEKRCYPSA